MRAHLFCAIVVFSGAFVLADASRSRSGGDEPAKNGHTTIERNGVTYTFPFELPTAEEIARVLHQQGTDVNLENRKVECELLSMRVHEARHYDFVGRARMHSASFRYTISADSGNESVYMDYDHLVREQVPAERER